jgi:hypothetical protein
VVAYCSEVAVGHTCPVKAKYTASQWLVTVTRSSLVRRRDYGEEWAFVAPYLTLMSPEASHQVYALREVVSVLRWIVRGEAPWRLLPTNVPNTLREPPFRSTSGLTTNAGDPYQIAPRRWH